MKDGKAIPIAQTTSLTSPMSDDPELRAQAAFVGRHDARQLTGPGASLRAQLSWHLLGKVVGRNRVRSLANPILEAVRREAMENELASLSQARRS